MTDDVKNILRKNMVKTQNEQINNSFIKVEESLKSTKDSNANNSSFFNLNDNGENELDHIHNSMKFLTTYMKEKRPILGSSSNTDESSDGEQPLDKAQTSHIQHLIRTDLIQTASDDIEIHQADPNDPLYSVTTFQELNLKNDLLKGIVKMNFRKPSGIQEKSLPILLGPSPKNIIAQSQSGTGKTATFLLTMFSKVDINEEYCQCLCMAPTRELALQIADVAKTMSQFMNNIKISCAVKGMIPNNFFPPLNQNREVTAQVVIGTPGTLKFWTQENSQFQIYPKKLRVFVLDEADVLIENPEFLNISRRIKSKLSPACQILLFSATYDDNVMEFAREFVPRPTEIRVKPQELTLKNIRQFYIKMANLDDKYIKLIEIFGMKSMGQCIIFCESRRIAGFLKVTLEKDGHLSSLLSGDLDVHQREMEISDFRSAKTRILIATNLCSRGIDIPQVNLIINWDMPRTMTHLPDCETYLHRIGRSGRFGKTGLSINFIANSEDFIIQQKIIQVYGAKIDEMTDLSVITQI